MEFSLKLFFVLCQIVKNSAFSGDGFFEPEDEIVDRVSPKTANNDYKELTTIFDFYWLANLWPQIRSGAHLNLGSDCKKDLTIFFEQILDGKAWTMQAIDASGHMKTGVFWGKDHWIGSKSQCASLNEKFVYGFKNKSHYENIDEDLMGYDEVTPPYSVTYSVLRLQFNITKTSLISSSTVLMGLCFPKHCSGSDIHHLIEFSMNTYQTLKISEAMPRAVRILSVRVLDSAYVLFEDPFFYTISFVAVFIIIITLIGTIIDAQDDTITTVEEDEIGKPKFRQLCKSDISEPITIIQDSTKFSMNNNNNHKNITIDNNTNDFIFGTPKRSMQSIFTVDGLIQNKFSDSYMRNENFFNMQKFSINIFNEQETLKAKKCKRKRTNSLKKRKISTDNTSMLADHRCKKQKYVLSCEEPSLIHRYICDIKNIQCLQNIKCIDKNSNLAGVLMCFSLKNNIKRMFCLEISEDNLSPVHGVKVLTLVWILFVQTALILYNFSDNKKSIEKHINNMLSHSTYAVDTFFVISGLLTSYFFMQQMKDYSSDGSVGFGAAANNIYFYLETLARRYLRFTSPYVAVLCLVELSSRYFHSNDVLEFPDLDHVTCSKFWWRNLIYFNTFYPIKEMCIQSSWFISFDMQFYMAAILILMVSTKCPKLAAMLFSVTLVTTWSIGALVTLKSYSNTDNFLDPFYIVEAIFEKPWLRVGPYVTGLGAGWILSKTNCCLIVTKTTSFTLWLLSICILLITGYGLHDLNSEHSTNSADKTSVFYYITVAYTVMGHTTWAMAITWIILACVTGYGGAVKSVLSLRYLLPISRLSYTIYLTYPLMLKSIFTSAEMVQHYTLGTLIVYYIGISFLTFISSLLISVLLESPVIALLKQSRIS